jgi:hypothetical protein
MHRAFFDWKPRFRAARDEPIESNVPLVGMCRYSTRNLALRNRANEAMCLAARPPLPPNGANEAKSRTEIERPNPISGTVAIPPNCGTINYYLRALFRKEAAVAVCTR